MLLNRAAYHKCGIDFLVPDSDSDVGVVLADALGAVGFDRDQATMERYFHHLGGGGGYHSYVEFEGMRAHLRDIVTPAEGLLWSRNCSSTGLEMLPDGRIVVHLDKSGLALCGKEHAIMRTGEVLAASCKRCLIMYKRLLSRTK